MDQDFINDNGELSFIMQQEKEDGDGGDLDLIDLIKSLKSDNKLLRVDIDKQATLYNDKIKEYDEAIVERDKMINQLKLSLGNCIEQRNQLEKEFNVEIVKLREEFFGNELKGSSGIVENYRDLQIKVQEQQKKINKLNEKLEASNQEKELIIKEWETKCDNMVKVLKTQHNNELDEVKALQENEMLMISKQFDILERNHKEDHSQTMKCLKEVVDTKNNIQDKLNIEKEKCIITSSKLKETQNLLESLQEFVTTSELSYKELLKQQHEKNIFDSETIMHLESKLSKNIELIAENEITISALTSELKAERKLKSELHSLLQVANSNLDICRKELLSLRVVKDTFQNDNDIFLTKYGVAKSVEMSNLSNENLGFLQERNSNSAHTEDVETSQLQITKLKSPLLEGNAELISTKEIENKLFSILPISNANLETCEMELMSQGQVRDSLQFKKEIYCTELKETLPKVTSLNQETDKIPKEVNDKFLHDKLVRKMQMQGIESDDLLHNYKWPERECQILKNKLHMLYNHVTSHLCPEIHDLVQLAENTSNECGDEFEVLSSFFNNLLEKLAKGIDLKKQTFTEKNKDSDGASLMALDEQTITRTGLTSEACVDGGKGMKSGNIRGDEHLCVSCKSKLVDTEDRGFQTCSKDNSSGLITKTVEEDYLMEEILIFPQHSKKRGSCMKIKDSSNLNEWKKKYFDVKFVNKSLKNENLSLKMSLQDKNAVNETSNIRGCKVQLPTMQNIKYANILPFYEQEELTDLMPNFKLLEDNPHQKEHIRNIFDILNNVFRNSDECMVGNQPIVDVCNTFHTKEIIALKFKLFTNFKSLCEYVQMLWSENQNLKKEIDKGKPEEQDDISLSSSLQISSLTPESENVQIKILHIELKIQIIFCEILKHLLKDKEMFKEISKEQLCAQEYIRCGLRMFLENSSNSASIKNNLTDCLLSEWLQVLEKCFPELSFAASNTRPEPSDTISLLLSIEEQLRKVLNELLENREVFAEVQNSLILYMEKNIHLLRDKETIDCSVTSINNDVVASHLICHKISDTVPTNVIGSEVDVTESEGMGASIVQAKEFDDSIEDINLQILKEFDDITISFINQELDEKIKIVETQKNLLMKILQNNQHKIAEICRSHMMKLKNTSSADLDHLVDSLINDMKQSLSEETTLIEEEYGEFLRQYTHEQSLHFNTHSLSFMELKERISVVLQDNACQKSENKNNKLFSEDFTSLNVATMSSFTNLETQKRILNIMTLMTLNLIHYYSISQNYPEIPTEETMDNLETLGTSYTSFDKSKCKLGPCSSIHNEVTNFENLSIDQHQNKDHDEAIFQNPLDTTVVSEGMLEDLDSDDQIKKVLSTSCANLMAALKGKFDEISIIELEKEVQEFIISLQASAGMLKIKLAKEVASTDYSITLESGCIPDLSQNSNSNFTSTDPMSNCRENPSLQETFHFLKYASLDLKECSGLEFKESDENVTCLQGDSTLDYTDLKCPQMDKDKLIESLTEKLKELLEQRNLWKKQLHQINGHLQGVLEEKKFLDQEKSHMEEKNIRLTKELQEMKDSLENLECKNKEVMKSLATSPNNKRSAKEIKEKVKAILAAKDIDNLEQKELVARVRDLENILDDLGRSKEEITEALNIKVSDLTQQLDHADLQLKKARQFLDQQAAERDLEFDVLIKDNEKLNNLLKEKEALAIMHQNILKDVSGFEKEFFEKNMKLEAAKQEIVDRETDLKSALDKIKDLRDITQSLELQLTTKCSENLKLKETVQLLTADLMEENRLFHEAKMQLEKILCDRRTSIINSCENDNVECEDSSLVIGSHVLGTIGSASKSLLEEFENENKEGQCPKASQEYMLQSFVDLLQRSTGYLESLQVQSTSGLTVSDEELSVRERLEITHSDSLEDSQLLSPSSLELKLEDRLKAFERTVEAAVKYSRDLEMRIKVIKSDYEEVVNERDELHQKLSCLFDLKNKLENSSIEYNDMQQSFCELKKKLLDAEEKLSVNVSKISELELTNDALKNKIDNQKNFIDSISAENSKLLLHIEVLEKKVNELEDMESKHDKIKAELDSKILELCTERDCLQKQYSKQLLKLSSMESRLEDIRRADSPHDHELKIKIISLQAELTNYKETINSLYRQNDELCYTLKDLKEKLLLRDEELDKLNRSNFSHLSGLPKTDTDDGLHQIQTLKKEIEMQKEKYEKINEELRKENEKLNLSGTLLKDLLDQKNTEISHLKNEFNSFKQISETLEPLANSGYSYGDIFELLKNNLVENSLHSQVNKSFEIPRKQPEDSPNDIASCLTSPLWDIDINKPCVLNVSAFEEANALSIQPSYSSNLSFEPIYHSLIKEPACAPKELGCSTVENDLQKELHLLKKDIEDKDFFLSQQKFMLTRKDQEIEELNVQLNDLITQLKDNSTINEKRLNKAHQMHSGIIHEMNQKNIEREKQLCNDYEERMASQITDLSVKLAREKSESLKELKNYYVTILEEKDCLIAELNKILQENKIVGKADTSEDMHLKFSNECSNCVQLVRDTNDQNQTNPSHDSSVVSIPSKPNKNISVTNRIQMLMAKVLNEGEQVLTQTERLFLEQNCDAICSTHWKERSSPENFTASNNLIREPHKNAALEDTVDKPIFLKHISHLKKDVNKKVNLLQYCSKREESFAKEWQEQMEIEKIENEQLRNQFITEKKRSFKLTSELVQVRCQLQVMEKQIKNLQQEHDSMSSQIESLEHQNHHLEEAFHDERNNFSRVSLTLDHQRKLATSSSEHQNKLIQELRKTLEEERKRVMTLVSQLHNAKLSPDIVALLNNTSMSLLNENLCVRIDRELESGYTKDQEIEMKLRLEEAELNLKTFKEKYIMEQGEHLSQLGEQQMKISQMQKRIQVFETEKEAMLHQKMEETLHLKEQLNKLQNDNIRLKLEFKILISSSRDKKDVQEKNSNSVDDQNLKEYMELQRNQCKELNLSIEKLSDDHQNLKQTIESLEAYVLELKEKVAYYNSKSNEEIRNERIVLADERTSIEAKNLLLQSACRQLEARNLFLINQLSERNAQQERIIKPASSDMGIKYLLWKYNRCESYRKALIWQKNFLLVLLQGFQKTESQTLQRLTSIAQRDKHSHEYNKSPSRACRFRPAVLVIISIHRMKYLVKRWQLGRKLEDSSRNSTSTTDPDDGSLRNSEEHSSIQHLAQSSNNILENFESRPMETCYDLRMTGQTPPTKDKSKNTRHEVRSGIQKNSYDSAFLSNYDDYISRIEHIHAILGITSSKI